MMTPNIDTSDAVISLRLLNWGKEAYADSASIPDAVLLKMCGEQPHWMLGCSTYTAKAKVA